MVAEAMPWGRVTRAFASWLTTASGITVASKWRSGAGAEQVTVVRVGGTDQDAQEQLDVWAATEARAEELAAQLCTLIDAMPANVTEGVALKGATVQGARSVPDDAYARYLCDIVLVTAS